MSAPPGFLESDDVVRAHLHSSAHHAEVRASERCGCFYCLAAFAPDEIDRWITEADGRRTALCPACGIDSVLGSASGFPVTPEFLGRMNACWF